MNFCDYDLNNLTILHDDNATYNGQIREGYIKGDPTEHILSKFLYTHELQKSGEINAQQIRSNNNLINVFTKALSTIIFNKFINQIGMTQLKVLHNELLKDSIIILSWMIALSDGVHILYFYFLCPDFVPIDFIGKAFNETILINDVCLIFSCSNGHSMSPINCIWVSVNEHMITHVEFYFFLGIKCCI